MLGFNSLSELAIGEIYENLYFVNLTGNQVIFVSGVLTPSGISPSTPPPEVGAGWSGGAGGRGSGKGIPGSAGAARDAEPEQIFINIMIRYKGEITKSIYELLKKNISLTIKNLDIKKNIAENKRFMIKNIKATSLPKEFKISKVKLLIDK